MIRPFSSALLAVVSLFATVSLAEEPSGDSADSSKDGELMSAETFAGLKLRCLGPAVSSGRVTDLAVDMGNRSHYFAAVASGGVWKTTNAGTTWTPVFDGEGSYSIGCVTMDPANSNVVWAGTGENNSQRSVSFGDGVYRTRDGGAHWENMGLGESEHIGMIVIDPRDTDTVYVTAQGPLWRSGGDRGLYKTTDGGANWQRILHVSDDTGINEVHMDPREPNVLYASAYQRRRHVWTLINGGPESAIYKSTDAGATWRKVTHGLPKVEMGRIGLDVSTANPDIVYAIIEAADKEGGFFRSTNRGETWEKMSDLKTTSPQYYNEIVCDPNDEERVYALDTILKVTEDGGKNFKRVGREDRHVDDHALWIDPADSDYLLVGCDGGVYETFDRGANWRFMPNLPVTQFYRVGVDGSSPFYFVYGGTQDNNTLGGPSRTVSPAGITNEDWFVTVGGDGYETVVDPEDPHIVYSLWQYGGLIRHDRRSGEILDIRPREAPGEEPYRWNWDTPLIMSPHDNKRLYCAANKLFRSDDRGNSWTTVSDELTRRLDRNAFEVMGKIQSADAVAKHESTSFFGNCVALAESTLIEGLIYVGTDDGLIQVTGDGGRNWRQVADFPGIPAMTYVSVVVASQHDADTVYAAFDNHKKGDFKPYLLKSPDRGVTWTSISGDLPARDIVYTLAEDHVSDQLLFAGTEFGAYFSVDGGEHWIKLKGDMPTISVRDIAIQKRESDLVLGTFGRGIYVLDDYSPLRSINTESLQSDALLLPVKRALRYIETSRLGGPNGRGSQGASFYSAPNPPFGAVFTYYLKEKLTTRREQRKEAEKKAAEKGITAPYPSIEELRAEDEEKEPSIDLIVRDETSEIVRRITGPRDKGFHRVAWDLRFPSMTPTVLEPPADRSPWWKPPTGPLALPGMYTVTLARQSDGEITPLASPQSFEVIPLETATFAADDRFAVLEFRRRIADLQRAVDGALQATNEAQTRIAHVRKALIDTPGADHALFAEMTLLEERVNRLLTKLRGDKTRSERNEPAQLSIKERVDEVVSSQWESTSAPTQTQRAVYSIAGGEFSGVLAELRTLIEVDLARLEEALEAAGAPWTPGRIPDWSME